MNFINDNQRRAVCASYNRFARGSDRLTRLQAVDSIKRKVAPMLETTGRHEIDVESLDFDKKYIDTSLDKKSGEQLGDVIKKLREEGLIHSTPDVPSKAAIAKELVVDLMHNPDKIDSIYIDIKDDKYLMAKFRLEMIRAITSNVIKDDDYPVQYLAEYDKTFESYLERYQKTRDMPMGELVSTATKIDASNPVVDYTMKVEYNAPGISIPEVEYVYET
jgi:hypothetical protein